MKNLLLIFLFLVIFISCKKENNDKTLKIYHLKPNVTHEKTNSTTIYGWFSKTRNDFFTVKNYEISNEQHKIKIDSFVLNYLKNDSFLTANQNVTWALTFFTYGDGIDEHTKHEYGTDYTIHNLFSYKKEIANFYFNTRVGYSSSKYKITSDTFDKTKRKIITNYFNSNKKLKEKIALEQASRTHFNPRTHQQETIKVIAQLISKGIGNKIKMAQYKFLKPITNLIVLEGDTLNVGYSENFKFIAFPKTSILTLVKSKQSIGVKNYYIFPEYNPNKGIQRLTEKELK